MSGLDQAIAAAREARQEVFFANHQPDREEWIIKLMRAEERLGEVLAALDAARGEAVATVTSSNTAMTFSVVTPGFPDGTKLFAAPPAAAVPPERDWTMIQSGDASIPAWVVHYANAIGAYMKGQNVKHWAVGPVQSRNEAQQPAALAVPDGLRNAEQMLALLIRKHGDDADAAALAMLAQQPAAAVPEGYALSLTKEEVGGLIGYHESCREFAICAGFEAPYHEKQIEKLRAMLAAAERKGE